MFRNTVVSGVRFRSSIDVFSTCLAGGVGVSISHLAGINDLICHLNLDLTFLVTHPFHRRLHSVLALLAGLCCRILSLFYERYGDQTVVGIHARRSST